jgi:transposase
LFIVRVLEVFVMATRRSFTREFKLEALRMVTEQGLSVSEVARDLDIHANLLRSWKRQFGKEGAQAFPGNGKLSAEDEELRQLRQEVRQLRSERDILKKATAFFVKEAK